MIGVILGVGALLLLGAACMPVKKALVMRTDFESEDPLLAEIAKEAAAEWAKAGVLVASIVTVNEDVPGALAIKRWPRDDMWSLCNIKHPEWRGDGCSHIRKGEWKQILIPEDLTDRERLKVVMMHEMAHIFMSTKEHHDGVGIMSGNATSITPTADDLEFMARFTTVLTPDEMAEMQG